jgi:hypothetical protein
MPARASAVFICLAFGLLLMTSGCIITSRPPQAKYILTNNLSEGIQVEAFDRKDKPLVKKWVEPSREASLGCAQRLVIHEADGEFEYVLPLSLTFWAAPPTNSYAWPYAFTVGGRWQLSITESNLLEVKGLGGAVISGPADRKPPLGFPLRPRSPNETFDQYKAIIKKLMLE